MPRSKKGTPPAYQLHSSGQARVIVRTVSGRRLDLLLGPHDALASRYEYQRILNVLLANNGRYPDPVTTAPTVAPTVDEVILAWWQRYGVTKWGEGGKELVQYRYALRPLRELYGNLAADQFSPKCLKAVSKRMVAALEYHVQKAGDADAMPRWLSEAWVKPAEKLARLERHGKRKEGQEKWVKVEVLATRPALSRKVINRHLVRIRGVFNWAVSEELIPASVAHGLRTVKGLQPGEKGVKESKPRPPAFWEDAVKILPLVSRPVAAMLQLQWFTGMRSGEVRIMRTLDIDRTDPACWFYRPGSDAGPHGKHKNAWRGQDRAVPLGPQCIEVLAPWLREEDPAAFLFQPKRASEEQLAKRRTEHTSHRRRSQCVRRKQNPKRAPGDCYSAMTYPRAVARACKRAGIRFSPYALRHGRKMDVERQHGSDGARCILGQKSIEATQHYGEIDQAHAKEIMQSMG